MLLHKIEFNSHYLKFNSKMENQVLRRFCNTFFESLRFEAGVESVLDRGDQMTEKKLEMV